MMWEKTTIGKHCTVTSSKRFHLSDRSDSGIPFYCSKEIIQKVNGQEITDYDYIKVEAYEEVKKKFGVPECGDLLITTRGTYGVPYLYNAEDKFYFADGNLTWLKDFDDLLVAEFLYYWILSYEGQKKIDAIAKGTAQKAVPIALIKDIELSIPDVEMQKKIAKILTAYDDFIENNQKQIKLLEEAAQRLYKEWFVDLRFPGYEDVEIVDGVPEGWEITPINMVANLKAGGDKPKTFSEKMTNENKIPVFANGITGKGLMGFTDKAVINNPSVTISARGTVGVVFLRTEPYVPIVRLISVTPIEDKVDILYLYLYLINQNFRSTGAAQQQITVPLLKSKNIICPTDDVRKSFNDVITSIFNKIDILEKHINKLTEARDRLLPKLMNGEIEV